MITIEVDDQAVIDALRRLQARAGEAGMRPALSAIGEYLAETTKQRFETGTGLDGQRWAPNKPATLAKKKGTRPLVDSGQLATSIRHRLMTGGVAVGTNRFASLFTGGAAVHQFGSRDGKIPPRPFLGLSEGDRTAVLRILARHLT